MRWRLVVVGAIVLVVAALAVRVLALSDDDASDASGPLVGHFEVDSRQVPRTLPVTTLIPPGIREGERRPLLLFLHGRGSNEDDHLGPDLSRALVALGDRAPVIVFPYGGVSSYWHNRDDGDWADYVMDEVLPRALATLPVDPKRVAVGGISMGGFGALDLARTHPRRFCAVGGHSPALFESGGASAAGAFDDADDFARHDVIGSARANPDALGHQPVWLDVGKDDPFYASTSHLAAELRAGGEKVTLHRWSGGHDGTYWRSHYDEYLRFYARACAARPAG
jgi:enterochelin esterase-like enzyme